MAEFECPFFKDGELMTSFTVEPSKPGNPAISVEVKSPQNSNSTSRCELKAAVDRVKHGTELEVNREPVTCARCGRTILYKIHRVDDKLQG